MPTFHLVSSTISLNGGISAGSFGSSLLNISANSVQRAPLYDDDDIDHDKTDTFKPWSTLSSYSDFLSLIHFLGDEG